MVGYALLEHIIFFFPCQFAPLTCSFLGTEGGGSCSPDFVSLESAVPAPGRLDRPEADVVLDARVVLILVRHLGKKKTTNRHFHDFFTAPKKRFKIYFSSFCLENGVVCGLCLFLGIFYDCHAIFFFLFTLEASLPCTDVGVG